MPDVAGGSKSIVSWARSKRPLLNAGRVDVLPKLLHGVRLRVQAARVSEVFPWAAALGALGFALSRLGGLTTGDSALVALGLTAPGTAIGVLVWNWRQPLTDERLARLLDAKLDLLEMVGTAVEFSPDASTVTAALHKRVDERLTHVLPRDVIGIRWTRGGTVASLMLLTVAIAQGAGLFPDRVYDSSSRQRTLTVDSVRALAEVAGEAAAVRSDPHMEAISKALEELAGSIDANEPIAATDLRTLDELADALGRLAGVATAGSQRTDGAFGTSHNAALIEADIAELKETLGRIAGLTGLNEDLLVFAEDSVPTAGTGDNATLGDAPSASGQVGGDPSTAASTRGAPHLSADGVEGDLESGHLVGASSQAGAGASDLAGEGTHELFGDGGAQVSATSFQAVGLQGAETEDGRQVPMEVSPSLKDSPQSAEESWASDDPAWQNADLHRVMGLDLPFEYRSVAGSYFLPPQETR